MIGRLLDRNRLSGEGGFVDRHVGGEQHPAIGGHPVSCLEQHDVARHEFVGRDLLHLAIAAHPHDGHEHALERGERAGCLALLHVPEHRVDDQHHDDHGAVLHVTDRAGDERRRQQDHHDAAAELIHEHGELRWSGRFGQSVGADGRPTEGDLGCGQSDRWIDLLRTEHRRTIERTPDDGRRRVGGSLGAAWFGHDTPVRSFIRRGRCAAAHHRPEVSPTRDRTDVRSGPTEPGLVNHRWWRFTPP